MNIKERIENQETKYRKLLPILLTQELSAHTSTLQFEPTPIRCHVDLYFTANTKVVSLEIKERNEKNKHYPTVPLKVKKLQLMEKDRKGILMYASCVRDENTCYIFNLDKIDVNKLEQKTFKLRKTQYLETSDYEYQTCYLIPKELATYKIKYDEEEMLNDNTTTNQQEGQKTV